MSHFAVMVIGPNVDKQLAPYHEFECTGEDNEFVKDVDETDDAKSNYEAYVKGLKSGEKCQSLVDYTAYYYDYKVVSSESEINREGEHKYGYILNGEPNTTFRVVRRTNPNAKWDWYVVGGRWSGFLRLKGKGEARLPVEAIRADEARKGDIWFDFMRNEAGTKAAARYDQMAAGLDAAGLNPETIWEPWEVVRERHAPPNIDAARKEYRSQPAVAAIETEFKNEFFLNPDDFRCTRELYIQRARDNAISTYAFVKDGEWVARGEMGWFGMSSDDVNRDEWARKFNEMLDSLPDDTEITVVDCHI